MKNPRTIAIVVGTLALLAIGLLFFRSPKPIIEIKAEKLTDVGPFPLVNTYLTSVIVVILLIVIAKLATRNLSLVPRGLQNAVEAVADALYTICINTAGEKNARRFFPVVATIFVYIWIANWLALLPGFISIGAVEPVTAHHWREEAAVISKTAGISLIKPNDKAIELEAEAAPSFAAVRQLDSEIAEAKAANAPAAELDELGAEREEALVAAREEAIRIQLPKAAGIDVDTSQCEELTTGRESCEVEAKLARADEAEAKLKDDGKQLGIIVPYLRSMNTDINSPLSIAIWAMIFIEFWGITALGFFKYAGKFLNFSSPINFVVGILEFIAELARLISFTFRLFGNMLAGEILLLVMTFLVPFLVALPFYALETFVGVIQAFVFAMLTLVFGTLAVSSHEGHDELGGHDDPDRPLEGPVPVAH